MLEHQLRITLVNSKTFANTFGTIEGDEHKRIPPEFQDTFKKEPLIAKKSFYYVSKLDTDLITSDQLLPAIMKIWYSAQPMNQFLDKARS